MPRVLKTLAADDEITSLWWSELGLIAGDLSGAVYLWPIDNSSDGGLCHLGEFRRHSVHTLAVLSVCSIGASIISCSLDGSVCQWDSRETSAVLSLPTVDPIRVLPVSSDETVLIGTASGAALFYSVAGQGIVRRVELFSTPIVSLAMHPIDRSVFVLTQKELVLVGIDNGDVIKRAVIAAECCTGCAVAGDGYSCAISTTEGTVRVVDVVSFAEAGAIFFEQTELIAIAAYDYGKHFIVTSVGGRIGVFDLRKMVKEPGLKVGKKPLVAVSVNEGVGKAAVAGCDSFITLLDFE